MELDRKIRTFVIPSKLAVSLQGGDGLPWSSDARLAMQQCNCIFMKEASKSDDLRAFASKSWADSFPIRFALSASQLLRHCDTRRSCQPSGTQVWPVCGSIISQCTSDVCCAQRIVSGACRTAQPILVFLVLHLFILRKCLVISVDTSHSCVGIRLCYPPSSLEVQDAPLRRRPSWNSTTPLPSMKKALRLVGLPRAW